LPYSLSVRELGSRVEVELRVNHVADLLIGGLTVKPFQIHGRSKK